MDLGRKRTPHALIPIRKMRAHPPPTADTPLLNAPCESRAGLALANRVNGYHVGLEGFTAIEEGAVSEEDAGTAQGKPWDSLPLAARHHRKSNQHDLA